MKIKVCIENREKIESFLKEVNGTSKTHTFAYFEEAFDIVYAAEKKLCESSIPKKERKGAYIFARSGGSKKPSSYKYQRNVTLLQIKRGGDSWFITSILSSTIYPNEAGFVSLVLTPDQKKKAIDKFLASFHNI